MENKKHPELSRLVTVYHRIGSYYNWVWLACVLAGVAYLAVLIFAKKQPATLPEGALLTDLVCRGNTIVVSTTNDGAQELFASSDSGHLFEPVGTPWPLADSVVAMAIAPDDKTILVLGKRGILHVMHIGEYPASTIDLPSLQKNHRFNDLAFLPGTDSVYLFGTGSMIVALNWKDGNYNEEYLPVEGQEILHMHVEQGKEASALTVDSTSHTINIFWGNSISAMKLLIKLKPPVRDTDHDEMRAILYSVFLDFLRGEIAFKSPDTGSTFDYSGIWGLGYPPVFHANSVLDNDEKGPVFYGNGPFIQQDSQLDSIPEGGIILSLGLKNHQPSWAIVQNNDANYLYRKQGRTWKPVPLRIRDDIGPPVQNFLLAILLFLLVLPAFLFFYSHRLYNTILDRINSDAAPLLTKSERPLSRSDPDLLGFVPVEEAVLRIIRNPLLQPPMSIVISGPWGSGKSSMMNRIRETLQTRELSDRFQTTWFNAWHLQGEKNLLDAFLLNIINCYEKNYPPFSFFRLRIALARYYRLPLWKKLGLGFSLGLLASICILLIRIIFNPPLSNEHQQLKAYADLVAIFSPGELSKGRWFAPISAILLILGSIFFVNRQFVPTGLSAFFQLLPRTSLEVENADPGVREKFREQYWEIMGAAQKHTRLVVFIDDLDRISGDKILELLEGINFISDIASRPSDAAPALPNTIFVLGMHTREVAHLVGTQLNKINGSASAPEQSGMSYIEKMAQLVVTVPFDSDNSEQLKKLYEA